MLLNLELPLLPLVLFLSTAKPVVTKLHVKVLP